MYVDSTQLVYRSRLGARDASLVKVVKTVDINRITHVVLSELVLGNTLLMPTDAFDRLYQYDPITTRREAAKYEAQQPT